MKSKTEHEDAVTDRACILFKNLSSVNFKHAARSDPQQNFMEPLEVIATGIRLRPAAVFGQSSYNDLFLRQLEKFADKNGIKAFRTAAFAVDSELLMLPNLQISRGVILGIVDSLKVEAKLIAQNGVLWLYTTPGLESQITMCVEGKAAVGSLLGYPMCCVNSYLGLEAKLLEVEFEFYEQKYGTSSDADVLNLRRQNIEISGQYGSELEFGRQKIQKQQALSIHLFPFNHFIACDDCLGNADSPAARLNESLSRLALGLNKTFARKFTDYGKSYFASYQQQYPTF